MEDREWSTGQTFVIPKLLGIVFLADVSCKLFRIYLTRFILGRLLFYLVPASAPGFTTENTNENFKFQH